MGVGEVSHNLSIQVWPMGFSIEWRSPWSKTRATILGPRPAPFATPPCATGDSTISTVSSLKLIHSLPVRRPGRDFTGGGGMVIISSLICMYIHTLTEGIWISTDIRTLHQGWRCEAYERQSLYLILELFPMQHVPPYLACALLKKWDEAAKTQSRKATAAAEVKRDRSFGFKMYKQTGRVENG